MSDKTLVERLREVNSNRIKHPVCQIANAVGVGCGGRTCDECGTDTAHALADAIEREYLPRPRFDDGEPVQFGDMAEVREGTHGYASSNITHKEPDSLERIEEDAKKVVCDYFGSSWSDCDNCRSLRMNCGAEMALDLLRRQREVLERGSNG